MKKPLQLTLFSLILLSLVACGAYYTTQYNFVPPTTPEGQQCATVCMQDQMGCRQSCADTRAQCQTTDQIKSSINFLGLSQYSAGKAPGYPALAGLAGIQAPNCQNINHCEDGCAARYRDCYTVCGGQVVPQQVCTSNCP